MKKLYIPQVGDKLKLSSNWECKIFNEYRNEKVFTGLGMDISQSKNMNIDVSLPKGTVLKVERLYVRAPASSYDSITFRIDECPIKSLLKARFWVKLMDANNIEFEEVVLSIASYSKLSDCVRFVALSNGFQNSSDLNDDEEIFVGEKLFNHFKDDNVITIKFSNITPYIIFQTMNLSTVKNKYGFLEKMEESEKNKLWNVVKNVFKETEVILDLIPVLDGFVYVYRKNDKAIEMDKILGLYEQYNIAEYRNLKQKRGSFLSYDFYTVRYKDKNWRPSFLLSEENLEDVDFQYKNQKVDIKNIKDFDKLMKSVRKEINAKLGK